MARRARTKATANKDVYTLALERVEKAYDLFDHVCVAFSGGKDSTCVLNVALEVARKRGRLPLRVITFDEEAITTATVDYMRRVSKRPEVDFEWYCLPIKHRNACSKDDPYWYPWAPEDRDKWCQPLPPEAITHLPGYDSSIPENRLQTPEVQNLFFYPPSKYGNVGFLMGIRADESLMRYQAVTAKVEENYIVHHKSGFGGTKKPLGAQNVWKVYPIYDWTTPDVWTAIGSKGWDYCESYDHMEMVGISWRDQRLAPPYGEQPMQGLFKFQMIEPELWEKMLNRVPGARTAARYSQTELYGFKGLPPKDNDTTWQEYIKSLLDVHGPKIKQETKARIRQEIRRHYKTTQDPILTEVEHPSTGASWKILAKIAYRGDTKGRIKLEKSGFVDQKKFEKAWAKYNEARRKEGL